MKDGDEGGNECGDEQGDKGCCEGGRVAGFELQHYATPRFQYNSVIPEFFSRLNLI